MEDCGCREWKYIEIGITISWEFSLLLGLNDHTTILKENVCNFYYFFLYYRKSYKSYLSNAYMSVHVIKNYWVICHWYIRHLLIFENMSIDKIQVFFFFFFFRWWWWWWWWWWVGCGVCVGVGSGSVPIQNIFAGHDVNEYILCWLRSKYFLQGNAIQNCVLQGVATDSISLHCVD